MVVWMVVYTLSTCLSISLNVLVYFELNKLRHNQERRGSNPDGANSRAKNEAFITVFYLSIASIFCRLPLPLVGMLLITIIENVYGYTVRSWSLVSVVFLLYLVFVVDPVIYLVRMPDIRLLIGIFMKRLFTHKTKAARRTKRNATLSTKYISVPEKGGAVQLTPL